MKFELNEKVENFHFWIATSRVTTDRQNIFHRTQGEKKTLLWFFNIFRQCFVRNMENGRDEMGKLGAEISQPTK